MWSRVAAVVLGVGISACGGSPRDSGNARVPLNGTDGGTAGASGRPALDACVQARVNALPRSAVGLRILTFVCPDCARTL